MNALVYKKGSIKYGQRYFEFLIKPAQRKTLEISVFPDNSVVVVTPLKTDYKIICDKVKKRAGWIAKQKAFFSQYQPRTPARQYIGGETHLYMGRAFRLKIIQADDTSISLKRGYFLVKCSDKSDRIAIRNMFRNWYREKAEIRFREIFEYLRNKYFLKKNVILKIQIKEMKTRWGSLSKSSVLTLNAKLIQAPKDCIEYVITHELCHLKHDDHGKGFYRLLKTRMPDWEARKEKLEKFML